jgi:hypothetical protein
MTSATIPICERKEAWSLPLFPTEFPAVCCLAAFCHVRDAVQIQLAFKSRHNLIQERFEPASESGRPTDPHMERLHRVTSDSASVPVLYRSTPTGVRTRNNGFHMSETERPALYCLEPQHFIELKVALEEH